MERRQVLRTAAGMAGLAGIGALGMAAPAGAAPQGQGNGGGKGNGHGHGHGNGNVLAKLGLVFLSHVNDPAVTNVFPGDPEFTLETINTIPEDGFYMQYVREAEHTGTHWGAPAHFQEGGLTADQLDPGDLFLPAVKIDIRAKAAANADYALTVADLMTRDVITGHPHDDLLTVAHTMTERRIRHLPVVDKDRVIGMVSIGDIVKAQRDHYQGEVDTLQTQLIAGERGITH